MFKKLCEPAKLYLLFTVIFIVMAVFNGITALTVIVKFAFALIWTLVLNWLCSKGFSGLAWIIVLMPFIFLFLTVFAVKDSFMLYIPDGAGIPGENEWRITETPLHIREIWIDKPTQYITHYK